MMENAFCALSYKIEETLENMLWIIILDGFTFFLRFCLLRARNNKEHISLELTFSQQNFWDVKFADISENVLLPSSGSERKPTM
jgi:hypothetical protein